MNADKTKCDSSCPMVFSIHGVSRRASNYARAEPREKQAFSVIEHLFDEVGEGRKDYAIFGHSAGDTDPNHKDLRRTPEAMKQGATRLARGGCDFRSEMR